MTDRIQLSTKKQFLFSIFAILLTWFAIELIFHLLTLVGWLAYNIFTPSIYTQETVKYQLERNGSPIFTDGRKVYRQPGVPVQLRDYNSEGFDPEDARRFNKDSTNYKQIGFFGDSYTEGLQVKRQQTFPRLIEQYHGSKSVKKEKMVCFNFGVGGTGTYHQYLRYLTVSKKTKLDHVVVGFFPQNDVLNNHSQLGKPFELPKAPYFLTAASKHAQDNIGNSIRLINKKHYWLRRTIGFSFLASGVYRLMKQLRMSGQQRKSNTWNIRQNWLAVYGEPLNDIWREAWQITELILLQFHRQVLADGAKFSLLLVADSLQIGDHSVLPSGLESDLDLSYPNRRLRSWAKEYNIDCVDSLPYFLNKKNELNYPYFSWHNDGHYSSVGHTTMAEFWHNREK